MTISEQKKQEIFNDICKDVDKEGILLEVAKKHKISYTTVSYIARNYGVTKRSRNLKNVPDNLKYLYEILSKISKIEQTKTGIFIAKDNEGNYISLRKLSQKIS